MWHHRAFIVVLALTAFSVACSSSEEKKRTYREKGDAAFAAKQYTDASLNYRNYLKLDPLAGDVRGKLAASYEKNGEYGNAGREYIRAADLLPNDAAMQRKAAAYLLGGREFEDARTRATRAVQLDPKNADAHIILGNAIAGSKDYAGAIKEIEEAISLSPGDSGAYTNKAGLLLAQGRSADALANFQKAVEIDPKSVPAQLALGAYYWNTGDTQEAEATVGRALAIDPGNPDANRTMALLYMSTGREAGAEPYVKAMVKAAGTPEAELDLADYYLRTGRKADAKTVLTSLVNDPKTATPAGVRLAEMEYQDNDHAAAYKRLDGVIAAAPADVDAHVTRARFLINDKRLQDALTEAQAATKVAPKSAPAHFVLGQIQAALGQTVEAKASFNEVVSLNPRAAVAQAALAALDLGTGNTESAVQLARDAMGNQPDALQPRLLLVRGLLSRGEVDRASNELSFLTARLPEQPTVRALHGMLLLVKKDPQGARRDFEFALQRDPANLDALRGISVLDAGAGQLSRARDRVSAQLTKHPDEPGLLLIAARLDLQASDYASGETKLRRVVELAPASMQAYTLLGTLYVKQKKLDEARHEFEAIASKQTKPIGAHTVIGMIYEMQHNGAEATKSYQRALELDPSAPVAANNLAFLYAQKGENLDQALALAKAAETRLPDEPAVKDTVGWVYYKKELPLLAVPELEKSVQQAPNNPEFQYHLGMAYARTGDSQRARRALEQALQLNSNFDGANDARQALTSLKD
jgi:Flp pilus assembly protein TadD